MKNTRTSQILTSLATISCLALLLADSAEPYCSSSKTGFDQTFDYTTTCNGNHSGRIRISTGGPIQTPVAGGRAGEKNSVTLVSGELPNADAFVTGRCADEDEPTLFNGIDFVFPGTSATSSSSSSTGSTSSGTGDVPPTNAVCSVKLGTDLGKHVDCRELSGTNSAGCTLQLTALP